MKNITIILIMFELMKLEISTLFVIKRENNKDKVQIKKFKNSLIKPLFKPIKEVIKSKINIIQSIKWKFKNSIIY